MLERFVRALAEILRFLNNRYQQGEDYASEKNIYRG